MPMRLFGVVCLLLPFISPLAAAPKIKGSVNYQFGKDNTTVTLACDRIQNDSSENATGTVQVRLWALDAPYKGGTIKGHVLASYTLEGLSGGMGYANPKRTLDTSLPSRQDTYHLCLTVSEYRQSGYVITDWRLFSKPLSLGPPKLFSLSGPWSWQANYAAGTLELKVGKISHTRKGDTGTLRLSLWATSAPYRGGEITGYQIGYVEKKALSPGYSYPDVTNTAKLKRPPAGTYHMNLVLSEYRDGGYVIVAYRPSNETARFEAP